MEADWEFEVASDAPVIDAAWSGYLDLRAHPEEASRLPEVQALPALASALAFLNAAGSPVWTAKCDVWEPDAFDPDELDAPPQAGEHALCCYIDLLPSSDAWATLDDVAGWCGNLCAGLRAKPLRQCRADLVVRRAFLTPSQTCFGITAYVTGCAATQPAAKEALSSAVALLARTIATAAA
jgi:hypothetical protein